MPLYPFHGRKITSQSKKGKENPKTTTQCYAYRRKTGNKPFEGKVITETRPTKNIAVSK